MTTTTAENNALTKFEFEVPHFSMHTLLQSSRNKNKVDVQNKSFSAEFDIKLTTRKLQKIFDKSSLILECKYKN